MISNKISVFFTFHFKCLFKLQYCCSSIIARFHLAVLPAPKSEGMNFVISQQYHAFTLPIEIIIVIQVEGTPRFESWSIANVDFHELASDEF